MFVSGYVSIHVHLVCFKIYLFIYRFMQFMNFDDDDVYEAIILLMKCKLEMVLNTSKKNIMKQLIAYQIHSYAIAR